MAGRVADKVAVVSGQGRSTRCGSRRKAPTSSRSTSANRSRTRRHHPRHPKTSRRRPTSSRLWTGGSSPPKSTSATTTRLKAAVDGAVEQLGRLDIVVANAGIGTVGARLDHMDEELWQQMIDINLSGVWKSVKAAVSHLNSGASIVLTSSVAGLKAYPHTGHYVAAKHGIVGLIRSFAVELGPRNIRVNSIHPTPVNTPMLINDNTFRLFRPDLENPGLDDFAPICRTFHILPIPWVAAEDISNAVVFLASDESRYMTGVALPVDAGSCLK